MMAIVQAVISRAWPKYLDKKDTFVRITGQKMKEVNYKMYGEEGEKEKIRDRVSFVLLAHRKEHTRSNGLGPL